MVSATHTCDDDKINNSYPAIKYGYNIVIEIPVDILWCVLYTAKYPQEITTRMKALK